MGGATWVTGTRVSAAKGMEETAWIFGGVGFRRSASFDDFGKCLLDPLTATPGNTATGLCDLWNYNGSTWQKYAHELLGACSAAATVTPSKIDKSENCPLPWVHGVVN